MTEPEQTKEIEATEDAEPEEPADPWWHLLGYGLFMWAITIGFYFYITAFETGDSTSARVWWPVALLYNIAGKWPVIGIGGGLGLLLVALGVNDYVKQKRA